MSDGYGLARIGCDAGGENNLRREHLRIYWVPRPSDPSAAMSVRSSYTGRHARRERLSNRSKEKRPAPAIASHRKSARYSVSSNPNNVSSEST
jgi:hypothetical protein